jgi:hypothetical protein
MKLHPCPQPRALWRPSEVGWPKASFSERPDQRDKFFGAFRVILGVPLQILDSDRRFEDYSSRQSHAIGFRFGFAGPLWHLDYWFNLVIDRVLAAQVDLHLRSGPLHILQNPARSFVEDFGRCQEAEH